ncbi:unnamed protein product [Blepharisma stoltei]|uniref:DUF726 domain-containing protein n=1 Tax=Blepharisma stoltei TaxID=1481888 RepID=A0AAU9JKC9_9CILI|nr:unnamed protein product [Blepharisma stoltei]
MVSDKTKIKKVLKKIMRWSKNLVFPINQVELEVLWKDKIVELMKSQGLESDLDSEIFQSIKAGSLDNLSQLNAESINLLLSKQSEELVLKSSSEIDAQRISSSILFLDTLENLTFQNKNSISNSLDFYYPPNHSARPFVKLEEILNKLEFLMIDLGKQKQPQVFKILEKNISSALENSKEAIGKIFIDCEGLTAKETHFRVGEITEYQLGAIKQISSKVGKIPDALIKDCQEKLKVFVENQWNNFLESYIRQLENNFEIFCQTGIQDLKSGAIRLFDNSRCSQESRIHMGHIVILANPSSLEETRNTLDTVLMFLNIPPEAFRQINAIDRNSDPEIFAERWLASTDPSARLFTIISLLLIFSNTYKAILPGYDSSYNDLYPSINREWLRRIVHISFQNKYEEILGKSSLKTEWTLILAAEQVIAQHLPSAQHNYWRFNHELLDVREDAQKVINDLNSSEYKNPELERIGEEYKEEINESSFSRKAYTSALSIYQKIIDKNKGINGELKDYAFECININSSLHVTIAISGWLSQGDEMNIAWQLLSDAPGQRQTYALRWDSKTKNDLVKKDFPSLIAKVVGYAMFPTQMFLPLVQALKNHSFKQSAKQAEITGIILAHFIANKVFGNACISLIGFSLGTRVIYSCLLELAKMNLKIIHDVTLLGGAAPLNIENWVLCRSVVSGRMVNTYSKTDKILSLLYTFSIFEKPIGNYEIPIENFENYNVTDLASGHTKYREVLDRILALIKHNA